MLVIGSFWAGKSSVEEADPDTEIMETQLETEAILATEAAFVPVETDSVESDETAALNGVSIDTAISLIESTMEENFANYEVSYEDGIITVNVWEEGIAVGALLAASGDESCVTAWNDLVDNQKYFCNTIWELVKTLGLTDVSVVVNVLNDGNMENVLLSTFNGIVLYDSVNE